MANERNPQVAAVIYGRQSLGKDSSIEQQLDLGRRRADTEGWTVHAVYSDGISASRHAIKSRTDWPKLLADVKAGRVAIIWLWESSRGDRRASSWLALLEDCRDRGVRIFVETHGRLYDMANPRDWRNLAEDGTDNEYESEKIRLRVTRAMDARAVEGKPHGPTPYGYRRKYELTSSGRRVLVDQEPDPIEAPVVREMYRRLFAGESLVALARELDRHGVRSRTGRPFSPQSVRGLVLRHCYAGMRAHVRKGELRAHQPGSKPTVTPAVWPALVSAEVWYQVHARLTAPERKTGRPGRANNPYSMIVRCDACGGPLSVRYRRGPDGQYTCRDRSCVVVGKPDLEKFLDAVICGYLAREDVIAELRRGDGADDHEDLQRVRDALAEARGELAALRAAVSAGSLTVASLVAAEPGLIARVEHLEAQDRELSAPPALAALITPGKDVKRRWKAAPVAAKREVARLLLTPSMLGEVRVTRSSSPGHPGAIEDRVTFRREASHG